MEAGSDGWEYDYVRRRNYKAESLAMGTMDLKVEFNEMGRYGWELVSVQDLDGDVVAWFKKKMS